MPERTSTTRSGAGAAPKSAARSSSSAAPADPVSSMLVLQRFAGNRSLGDALLGVQGSAAPAGEAPTDGAARSPSAGEPSAAGDAGPAAEAEADSQGANGIAATEPLVEDEADSVQPGQMRKTEFFARLKPAVCAAAEQGFAGTEHESRHCPLIELYLGFYERRDAGRINRDLPRFVGDGPRPRSAEGYIALIARRVAASVRQWAATGEITGVPRDIPLPGMELPPLAGLGALGALAGGFGGGLGGLLFKARSGGPGAAEPEAVRAELGTGRPLDAGVRARMEPAFGASFSHVRIHSDGTAGGVASRLNAHAFTVGEHVAFADQEYRPGTLLGDALIAHELAHVTQQGSGAASASAGGHDHGDLEHQADVAAVGVVARLWAGWRGQARSAAAPQKGPRLGAKLRLHRCSGCSGCETKAAAPPKAPAAAPTRDYTDEELQTYLAALKEKEKEGDGIVGGNEAHARARQVIAHWQKGDSLYILPARRKVQLAKELTQGTETTEQDQDSLLALLRDATDYELNQILAGVGREALVAKFSGKRRTGIDALLKQRGDAAAKATKEEGATGETARMAQQEFTTNAEQKEKKARQNCIIIVRTMAPLMFRQQGMGQAVEEKLGELRGNVKGKELKMTRAGAVLVELGAATGPEEVQFDPSNGNVEPTAMRGSAWDKIVNQVTTEGWHVFGLAPLDGYHSVTVLVEKRHTTTHLYWADQWAIETTATGELENFQQLPGSASGFRHYDKVGLDAWVAQYTREAWGRALAATNIPFKASLWIWKFQLHAPPPPAP
jgi:hypothetical protein